MATNKIEDLFSVKGLIAVGVRRAGEFHREYADHNTRGDQVITGGGSGLGLYAARALDANGAKAVYIIGRREATLTEAAKTGTNGSIKPVVGDASDKSSLESIVRQQCLAIRSQRNS
jgi:threonine dehydrogenase-like Zn-dependent dehydrogenase